MRVAEYMESREKYSKFPPSDQLLCSSLHHSPGDSYPVPDPVVDPGVVVLQHQVPAAQVEGELKETRKVCLGNPEQNRKHMVRRSPVLNRTFPFWCP